MATETHDVKVLRDIPRPPVKGQVFDAYDEALREVATDPNATAVISLKGQKLGTVNARIRATEKRLGLPKLATRNDGDGSLLVFRKTE